MTEDAVPSMSSPRDDRRDEGRITADVALRAIKVTSAQSEACRENFDELRRKFRLAVELQRQSHIAKALLNEYASNQDPLVAFIETVEKRFSVLSEMTEPQIHGVGNKVSHQINISSSGIRFYHHEPLYPNDLVTLRIAMMPTGITLFALGLVVYTQSPNSIDQDSGSIAAVQFTDIHPDDAVALRTLLLKEAESD